ncbi:hypothetical protein GCM10009727_83740 [Actinomadura napierensis]|uniref:Uncharacterized protein n=1 Tax=Actinomadura napierensis TaxID=267854 RepID=A0ABN3AFY0_9ACTN
MTHACVGEHAQDVVGVRPEVMMRVVCLDMHRMEASKQFVQVNRLRSGWTSPGHACNLDGHLVFCQSEKAARIQAVMDISTTGR